MLIGCDNKNNPAIQTGKVICVLFDLSETTNTPVIRKNYLDKFRMVLHTMKPGDVIEAALITEKSSSELNLSIECEFPVIESKSNTELFEKEARLRTDAMLSHKMDSLLLVADSVLFKPKRKILQTEIMSSLQVAERVFKSFKQPRKILVIFSDMMEDSKHYNFERENFIGTRINKIITEQKEKKLLPDLKGVKIYVAGASHKDSEKYNATKLFWFEYFKSTGTEIEQQNYGAALITFNE